MWRIKWTKNGHLLWACCCRRTLGDPAMILDGFGLNVRVSDKDIDRYNAALAREDLLTVRDILFASCDDMQRANLKMLLPDDLIASTQNAARGLN